MLHISTLFSEGIVFQTGCKDTSEGIKIKVGCKNATERASGRDTDT